MRRLLLKIIAAYLAGKDVFIAMSEAIRRKRLA